MTSNLLSLDDDCLYMIFRYLSLSDQLTLVDVNKRFCNIIKWIWSVKYRLLHTGGIETNELNNELYQKFFALQAAELRELTLISTKHLAFTSYLSRYTWRPGFDFYFSFEMPQLQLLDCQDSALHDGHIRLLTQRCRNLHKLRIASRHVTGAYLTNFQQLRALYMEHCNLSRTHWHQIWHKIPLTHLAMIKSDRVELLEDMLENLPRISNKELEELSLSACLIDERFLHNIKHFERLQKLNIYDILPNSNFASIGTALLQQVNNRISGLRIHSDIFISSVSYPQLFQRMLQLRDLHIEHSVLWHIYGNTTVCNKNLHTLYIHNFHSDGDSILRMIECCPNLKHIYLCQPVNEVTPQLTLDWLLQLLHTFGVNRQLCFYLSKNIFTQFAMSFIEKEKLEKHIKLIVFDNCAHESIHKMPEANGFFQIIWDLA